jgi:hypothetical protein
MAASIEDLLAIEEIRNLKARYMRFVDGHDWESWRKLMAEDVVFGPTLPDPDGTKPRIVGAEALVATVSQVMAEVHSIHIGFMPEIEILSADTARGIWGMEDILRWSDGRVMKGYGCYRETYVRQDGAWRFKTIQLMRKSEANYALSTGRVLP